MSIGNIILGTGCTWDENGLLIPKGNQCISEAPFVPAEDGSFTVSVCFTITTFNSNTSIRHPILCQAASGQCGTAGDLFAINALNKKINAYVAVDSEASDVVGITCDTAVTAGSLTVVDLVVKNNAVSLYVNGYLEGTVECSIVPFNSEKLIGLSTFTNDVGSTGSTSYRHYIRFHALNLYNRDLSAAEVEENYNTYISRFSS